MDIYGYKKEYRWSDVLVHQLHPEGHKRRKIGICEGWGSQKQVHPNSTKSTTKYIIKLRERKIMNIKILRKKDGTVIEDVIIPDSELKDYLRVENELGQVNLINKQAIETLIPDIEKENKFICEVIEVI